ncbi:MAG: PDZ domain-containing protein, partial [Thermoguttaceae bacterium]
FGDSDALDIGDWVLAIGNPFSLDSTVSAGIISAKGRSLQKVQRGDFLQTDASINPGNSGGPLINLQGEVVGINTAIASASGGNQGIGFAIPSNTAKWVVAQLIGKGRVTRAYLGVSTRSIDADLATKLGVAPRQGVLVDVVHDGTPSDAGGVKRNDVIISFDGQQVSSNEELQKVVERADTSAKHKLAIIRDKVKGEITLSVKELPDNFEEVGSKLLGSKPKPYSDNRVGIMVAELEPEVIASRFGIKATSGVTIINVNPSSVADRCGLKQGMVIEKIDDITISTTKDYTAAMNRGPLSGGFNFEVATPDGNKKIEVIQTKPKR